MLCAAGSFSPAKFPSVIKSRSVRLCRNERVHEKGRLIWTVRIAVNHCPVPMTSEQCEPPWRWIGRFWHGFELLSP